MFVVTSSFTLAKCVRDHQETTNVVSRVDQARLDKLRGTCGGAVREQGPISTGGRTDFNPVALTDRQIDAALVGMRGTPPGRALVREALTSPLTTVASVADCHVLYHGP